MDREYMEMTLARMRRKLEVYDKRGVGCGLCKRMRKRVKEVIADLEARLAEDGDSRKEG